jgi:hypothetical protein
VKVETDEAVHLKHLLAAFAGICAPLTVLPVSLVVRQATQVCTGIGRVIAAYIMPAAAPDRSAVSKQRKKETGRRIWKEDRKQQAENMVEIQSRMHRTSQNTRVGNLPCQTLCQGDAFGVVR